jgi:hypothetical protein
MSVQDDIMALMSQISGGGNRATAAGKEGADMYERMSDLITDKDKMYQAQREISNLYTPDRFGSLEEQMFFDPLTGGGVADVIRKYMDDARDGVPDYASVLGDESPPVQIEEMPNPVPRLPVDVQPLGPAPVDAHHLLLTKMQWPLQFVSLVSVVWIEYVLMLIICRRLKMVQSLFETCLWNNKANPCRVLTNSL